MSEILEFEGKNIDKAILKATQELCIEKSELKYEVISYGSTGIFGFVGVKKAKIKVIKPKPGKTISIEKEIVPDSNDKKEAKEKKIKDVVEDSELTELAVEFLKKIIDFITSDTTIKLESYENDEIKLNVSGGKSGIMIGKRGQTLEAIQYLVEKAVNKKSEKRVRVQVDVEGYMEEKKEKLQMMADKLSQKAKKIKKPVTIGQMNAHDRKIIHLFLKGDNEIRTQSVGDGYYRKLIIFPKNRNLNKKATPKNKMN